MEAKIFIIGAVTDGPKEIRFVLGPGGEWAPDIVINHDAQAVSPAPECFEPSEEVLDALTDALSAKIRILTEEIAERIAELRSRT